MLYAAGCLSPSLAPRRPYAQAQADIGSEAVSQNSAHILWIPGSKLLFLNPIQYLVHYLCLWNAIDLRFNFSKSKLGIIMQRHHVIN